MITYVTPLCNTGEWETIVHFIGVCPILSEFRRLYFGKSVLEEQLLVDVLNGSDRPALYKYVLAALSYRNDFIII